MQKEYTLHSISEAIEDIKKGKIVIVVDDEDRENEGDFFAAADLITPEIINFMTIYGRGLICTPLPEKRCIELDLELMVGRSTDPKETAFTISIDLIGDGVSTGISATDRSKTIKALMDDSSRPIDFARPGHIFPLRAKEGGVLRRPGHTEAAIDLAKLAGLKPGGVIVEIMNADGSMARLPDLIEISKQHNIKIISIKDLIEFRLLNDSLIEPVESMEIDTKFGKFNLTTFQQSTNHQIHYALTKGNWDKNESVPVRVQSSYTYRDFLLSLINGEDNVMEKSTSIINKEGKGAIVFLNNNVTEKLNLKKFNQFKDYEAGKITKPILPMDDLDVGIGAQILRELGISKIKLITKNPKSFPISVYNIEITEFIDF